MESSDPSTEEPNETVNRNMRANGVNCVATVDMIVFMITSRANRISDNLTQNYGVWTYDCVCTGILENLQPCEHHTDGQESRVVQLPSRVAELKTGS